jgi:hypothetical protein
MVAGEYSPCHKAGPEMSQLGQPPQQNQGFCPFECHNSPGGMSRLGEYSPWALLPFSLFSPFLLPLLPCSFLAPSGWWAIVGLACVLGGKSSLGEGSEGRQSFPVRGKPCQFFTGSRLFGRSVGKLHRASITLSAGVALSAWRRVVCDGQNRSHAADWRFLLGFWWFQIARPE